MIRVGSLRPRARDTVLNLPARWDAGFYVGIASGGYRWDPERPPYARLKFFPAYPLILRYVMRAAGVTGNEVAWLWGGVIVSTALFWIGLLYLFRLASALDGEAAARRTVWLTASYPFALFFGLPYTESLYLLSAVAAFYYTRTSSWAPAGAWGIVAGLSRPNGMLLAATLMLTAWRVRPALSSLAAMCAPIGGMLIFAGYLWFETGSPLVWATGQPGGAGPINPVAALAALVGACRADGMIGCLSEQRYVLLNVAAAACALIAAVPVARCYGHALATFIVLNTAMSLFGIGFTCMGRYTSVLFPIFLWMGRRLQGSSFVACLAISLVGQWLLAGAFFTWRPVY